MSLEESNKMSKKTPSQDLNSEKDIEWDLEEMKKSILDNADDYDRIMKNNEESSPQ